MREVTRGREEATRTLERQLQLLLEDDKRKWNPLSEARQRIFVVIAHWKDPVDQDEVHPTGFTCNLYLSVQRLISDLVSIYTDKMGDVTDRLWWEVTWYRPDRGIITPLAKMALDCNGNLLCFVHERQEKMSKKWKRRLLVDDSFFWCCTDEPLRRWYFP